MRFGIKILIICVVFVKINRYQVMQNTIVRTSYLYSQSEQPSKGGCRLPKTGENIYKRKDGRWEARFISGRKPDGCAKYTSVYARTYAAAKAKLEDRKRMIVSRPAGNCRLTVKELFVWYLSQAEIKPSTRARYVFLIEHHILPELGSIFVVSLTAKQLSDFLSQKRQSGRLHGGGLSAKSVRDIGVLIKAALRFASAEYHFYCDALNTKLPKTKQREIEPFSAWELDQLRKGLSPSPNHKDAGILLSANGGLRLGEVCALRVSDIDFQNGTVSIERAVQRVRQNGKTKLIIQTPKSEKSVRVIPLPNDMMAYLKKAVSGLSQNAYILTGRMRRLLLSAKEVITSDALIFYTQKRRKRRRYGMNSYNIGLEDRKIIEEMYNAGAKPCEIAARIGKCQATIYREIKRGEVPELNARCRPAYRAEVAEKRVTEAYRKRGRRKATE
jgi:integrase